MVVLLAVASSQVYWLINVSLHFVVKTVLRAVMFVPTRAAECSFGDDCFRGVAQTLLGNDLPNSNAAPACVPQVPRLPVDAPPVPAPVTEGRLAQVASSQDALATASVTRACRTSGKPWSGTCAGGSHAAHAIATLLAIF